METSVNRLRQIGHQGCSLGLDSQQLHEMLTEALQQLEKTAPTEAELPIEAELSKRNNDHE